jgi:3-isopropylmalate/(R)-2-methylmalate dehydratase small subunit
MQAFTKHRGIVAPMDRPNVDTDAIIPKQFLKSIKRSGFGPNAFDDWRYLDVGGPEIDNDSRRTSVVVHRVNTRFGRWMILASARY